MGRLKKQVVLIEIEVARAFDELGVLEVKEHFASGNIQLKAKLKKQKDKLWQNICSGIGTKLAQKIYSTEYYTNLFNANFELFEKIEAVEKDQENTKITAWDLHKLNKKRFAAKRAIQEVFLGKELEEVKM